MGTTPAVYFRFFVEPNLEDLRAQPDSVRLAFNAAISAFHLSDVYFEHFRQHDPARLMGAGSRKDFLVSLEKRERDFFTVQSAATLYKHFSSAKLQLDGCSPQSFEGAAAALLGISVRSKWRASGGGCVTVKRKDGKTVSLNNALETVVQRMWPSLLADDLLWV